MHFAEYLTLCPEAVHFDTGFSVNHAMRWGGPTVFFMDKRKNGQGKRRLSTNNELLGSCCKHWPPVGVPLDPQYNKPHGVDNILVHDPPHPRVKALVGCPNECAHEPCVYICCACTTSCCSACLPANSLVLSMDETREICIPCAFWRCSSTFFGG